ncbi:MAG: hypothetical protein NTU44_00290, partial [Bacteroidetes bacterium]|nr:hypothetical protein [Bacteroidota bacterium]
MINKRLLSVDMLRGFAIVAILVIHRIHYQWTGMETREILHTHIAGIWAPFIILTIILFTMAGIFYFLTGVVNAYSIFNRYSRDTCSKSRWMWGGIIGGLWLIMLNYFHRMFLVNGFVAKADGTEPEFPVGLLTGWARSGSDVVFRWSQITEPGTLSLIGMILIIITLTFGILFKNENHKHIFRINFILTVLAVIFLAASPFMKYWLRPEYEYAYQHGHYFYAACLGHVSQEFCLFPNLGYGFAGAIIGLALARKEDPKRMRRRNLIWALFLFIIGLTGVFLFDKHDEFGKRVIGACVSYVELGIFILMFNGLLKMYDFAKEEKKLKRWNRSLGIRRFGMVALTVYFFEPLVAE